MELVGEKLYTIVAQSLKKKILHFSGELSVLYNIYKYYSIRMQIVYSV